jgi:NADPH:quinone reductase-like Zn-dependent oxidoreductase
MKTPREHYTDLERLARLIDTGQLTPTIDKTYPLNLAPEAMRHLQAGQARGKIAIAVTHPNRPLES